jgi:hypothetical protein
MKGEICIKAIPEKDGTRLTGHCILEDVNGLDKFRIIDTLVDSLHMDDEDILQYLIYRKVKKITLDD